MDYWYDDSVPHAGNIMAEYGHEVDVCLLTPEQRKESSTMREQRGLIRMTMVHLTNQLDQLQCPFIYRQPSGGKNNDPRK